MRLLLRCCCQLVPSEWLLLSHCAAAATCVATELSCLPSFLSECHVLAAVLLLQIARSWLSAGASNMALPNFLLDTYAQQMGPLGWGSLCSLYRVADRVAHCKTDKVSISVLVDADVTQQSYTAQWRCGVRLGMALSV